MPTTPVLVLFVAAALGVGRTVRADEPPPDAPEVLVRIQADVDLSPVGDARARIEVKFPEGTYDNVKASSPDPRKFLQDLLPNRSNSEISEASARYDDDRGSVVLEVLERASARHAGDGRWEMGLEEGYEFTKSGPGNAPRPVAYFREKGTWQNGVKYVGDYAYWLPSGASEGNWDAGTRQLTWRLRHPPGSGPARLDVDLRARDRLMSTIYKVYGLGTDFAAQWVAKTVVRNAGPSTVRNLKLRYRLQGYGEWSPWEKFPEVVPGETVVSVHYPVLDASIAKVKSNTPANLLLEWNYEDVTGQRHEDDAAKRVVILGVNEFVFSNLLAGESFGSWQEEFNNAPLLAAWVSRNDGAVKEFAAMANRNSGGKGASQDDESAVAVLRQLYELLRANDFSYQHPPALDDKTVSFDVKRVQNVKFPRETIRDRSGTCIDLAILYAAMANAVGLEAELALIPGHCFPVIRLPGGHLVGVETTGVAGGIRFGSAGFDRVLEIGIEELKKAAADGRVYLIDLRTLWTRGVANPELEELPPDILQRWGIRSGPPASGPGGGPEEAPAERPATGMDRIVGLWGGKVDAKIDGGTLDVLLVGVDKAGTTGYRAGMRIEATVTTPQGPRHVTVVAQFEGGTEGGHATLASLFRKRTVAGASGEQDLPPIRLEVTPGDGTITGRVGNDAEGFTDFTLTPKKD